MRGFYIFSLAILFAAFLAVVLVLATKPQVPLPSDPRFAVVGVDTAEGDVRWFEGPVSANMTAAHALRAAAAAGNFSLEIPIQAKAHDIEIAGSPHWRVYHNEQEILVPLDVVLIHEGDMLLASHVN